MKAFRVVIVALALGIALWAFVRALLATLGINEAPPTAFWLWWTLAMVALYWFGEALEELDK